MDEVGWIKTHRSIRNSWMWSVKEPFDKRSAWLDMLMSAFYADGEQSFKGVKIAVKRGQFPTSVRILSGRWMWSVAKVNRYIDRLKAEQMINTERIDGGTLVTIVNYAFYQDDRNSSDTPSGTPTETAAEHIKRNKEIENKKEKDSTNVESKKKRYIIPPPVEDVAAYCAERNNGIDAQAFLDFYQSRGWMTGNTKIKDWQAAVRTWERKDREGNYGRTRRNEKPPETDEYATEFYKQLGIEQ